MIEIPVRVQLGIFGETDPSGYIRVDEKTIGNTSSWAGSYHILSMGRHFYDYIYRPEPGLQEKHDFPPLDCFCRLTSKTKSQQVIGNIGECIAAIFARKRLNANISDIALLTTNAKRMRPDYLMNLEGEQIGRLFPEICLNETHTQYLQEKRWWPVESKATKRIDSEDSRIKALYQLISFWTEENGSPGDLAIGSGLIVTFFYEDSDDVNRPHELLVSLILPVDLPALISQLNSPRLKSKEIKERNRANKETFRYFYGCSNQ